MEPTIFNRFRSLIYERSGITLGTGKEALVSARVGKRMRSRGISSYREYLQIVENDKSGEELVQLLDVISTNVTNFFREPEHFRFMHDAVLRWHKAGQQRFRFWSAACSTGEEPYTMSMMLLNAGIGTDFKILATDISTRALKFAQAGCYPAERVKGVPKPFLGQYFTRKMHEDNEDSPVYTVTEKVARPIVFRRLNLSAPPFPMHGPIDIAFCCNVMIYFDNQVRARLLSEMYRILRPGGYLMVGHAESLTGIVSDFRVIQPSIYQKHG